MKKNIYILNANTLNCEAGLPVTGEHDRVLYYYEGIGVPIYCFRVEIVENPIGNPIPASSSRCSPTMNKDNKDILILSHREQTIKYSL